MYGDCQVMQSSSMMMGGGGGVAVGGGGGGVVSSVGGVGGGSIGLPMPMPMPMNMNMNMSMVSDPLFSSTTSMGNPNHHLGSFMAGMPPFHDFSSIIPKDEMGMMRKEEEMESGSGSGQVEGLSCGEENDTEHHGHLRQQNQKQDQQNQNQQQQEAQSKKKRYHRHTTHQIQEMEALFKECPHPDDKQRMRLSQELGLKPRQVKFWFQNRRTQMKAQQDRSDNVILRAENESLKNENFRLQAAMRNVVCPNCGGPAMLGEMSFDEQHLRLENARLREELDRLSIIASRYGGRPMPPPPPMGPAPPMLHPSLDLDIGVYSRHFSEPPLQQHPHHEMIPVHQTMVHNGHHEYQQPHFAGGGAFVREQDKQVVVELAVAAAEQLVRMCRTNEPLWVRNGGAGGAGEMLDLEEHARLFPTWPTDDGKQQQKQKNGEMRREGTRDSGHVMMNSVTLVDAIMDVNKWMELFPSIVSTAKTLQVITPGVPGNGNGSLQLMYAELQVLSPLVPTREGYFFRYCQQNVEEGFWTIVDFPVDGFHFHEGIQLPSSGGYRRRPSGCVFQDMPNGYSMVAWVEQAEVEDKPVHQVFDQLLSSGVAFGACRWLAVLQHQCDRLASLMARNVSDLGVLRSPEARKNMMRLAQRMIRTFCSNISPSLSIQQQPWTTLPDSSSDTIRITTRKNTEPGQPNGVILSAVSTAWLPFSHLQVFELLTDEHRRSQLDVLSGGNLLHEVAHIANGSHQKNCVSLFRLNVSSNSSQNVELMLQESSTHPTGGSLVVYATVDVDAVQVVMSGEDPSYIPLLPTGFVVLPAPPPSNVSSNSCVTGGSDNTPSTGCLLTVGVQVLASAVPSAKLNISSVTAINNHLCNAVHQVTVALGGSGGARVDLPAAPATISDQ